MSSAETWRQEVTFQAIGFYILKLQNWQEKNNPQSVMSFKAVQIYCSRLRTNISHSDLKSLYIYYVNCWLWTEESELSKYPSCHFKLTSRENSAGHQNISSSWTLIHSELFSEASPPTLLGSKCGIRNEAVHTVYIHSDKQIRLSYCVCVYVGWFNPH